VHVHALGRQQLLVRANGLPAIASPITIEGNGATLERSSAAGTPVFRLFFVGADPQLTDTEDFVSPATGVASLALEDLTLTGGAQQGGSSQTGGGGAGMGGAIFNMGSLTINRVTVTDASATGGSAPYVLPISESGGGGMGSGPDATNDGGGFGGAVTGANGNSTGAAGTGAYGGGGGGFSTLDDATGPSGGGADTGFGGAPACQVNGLKPGNGSGAGYNCLGGNVTGSGGGFGAGGGNGTVAVNASGGGGVGGGGGGPGSGGGGGFGGGGGESASGGFGGGGGYAAAGGFAGGAGHPTGTGGGGGGGAGMGGGVFNLFGTVSVVNSTFTADGATGGTGYASGEGLCGALFNLDGAVSVVSSTLASNAASSAGGAIYNLGYGQNEPAGMSGSLAVADSILYGSTDGASHAVSDLVSDQPAKLADGSSSNTVGSSASLAGADVVGSSAATGSATIGGIAASTANPDLGALAFNGGPAMETMLPGNPLVASGACPQPVDERAYPRPATGCDVGAVQIIITPKESVAPAIAGTAKAGQTLTCSNGAWANNPSGYTYQWFRDGTTIQGATGSIYKVQTLDEGTSLTCTVTATNIAGSAQASSVAFKIPVPYVPRCPAATGGVSGTTLGLLKLGMTRKQAAHAYTHSSARGSTYKDFFCLGLASPKLLGHLRASERKKLKGRVVWISTDNARYSVNGIRAGATLAAAQHALPHGYYFRVGANYWYLAPTRGASAVLKVRQGTVQEVGIADKQLSGTLKKDRQLMTSFG